MSNHEGFINHQVESRHREPWQAPFDQKIIALLTAHDRPPAETDWSPIEAALYTPHPFTMHPDQAAEVCFDAVRASFAYQVEHNQFYRRYCESANVFPDDLCRPEDLFRIPLVPEHIFKGCPGPEQLVSWLASISSDQINWPASEAWAGGSYDEQIAALRSSSGLQVRSTSGSSGIPSFLPRDPITRRRSAHWKIITFFAMYPDLLDVTDLLSITLWPLDFSWANLITPPERVYALLDKKLGIETVVKAMTAPKKRGFLDRLFWRKGPGKGMALMEDLTVRLRELSASDTPGLLWTPPFLLYSLVRFIQEQGLTFTLGNHWRIMLGGGWKLLHERPLSEDDLRMHAVKALEIPAGHIHDIYGSTECLGLCGLSCEGGYKHIPHTVLHPLVFNEKMEPVGDGQWGRFGFLNPLIQAYPGFILTGDRVRLLSRCPACDRKGPALDSEISRMKGAEDRGCANMVRQVITERLTTQGKKIDGV